MLFSPTGEVVTGFVEPKTAMVGIPNAPATCIRPESFEMKRAQREIREIASFRSVFPAMSISGCRALYCTAAVLSRSPPLPKRIACAPDSLPRRSATAANRSGNHFFAGP